jgi:hypothetical protein
MAYEMMLWAEVKILKTCFSTIFDLFGRERVAVVAYRLNFLVYECKGHPG